MYRLYFLIYISCFSVYYVSGSFIRIIGGQEAPLEYGRYHASLQNLTGHHVCGGAVVSKRHIVTAAHCVRGVNPRYIRVVVGTTNLDVGGHVYIPKSIKIHPGYNASSREHDIAIIKMVTPFNSPHVQIINMRNEKLNDGDTVILSGFGTTEPNGESSKQMQALISSVFNQETCRFAMRYSRNITDYMFCTFTKIGEGTCHGDSGGPVTKNGRLVGLVSWGIPCAVGFPDVHVRIAPYIDWIQRYIDKTICIPKKPKRI